MQIRISRCTNSSNTIQCQSDDDINQLINKLRVELVYEQSLFNQKNYDDSVQSYLDSTYYYPLISDNYQQINWFLQYCILTTDTNLIMEDYNEKLEINMLVLTQTILNPPTENVLILYFRANFGRQILYRQYVKIEEILANLGGIMHILLLIGGIIVVAFNNITLNIQLINEAYRILDNNEEDKKDCKKKTTQENKKIQEKIELPNFKMPIQKNDLNFTEIKTKNLCDIENEDHQTSPPKLTKTEKIPILTPISKKCEFYKPPQHETQKEESESPENLIIFAENTTNFQGKINNQTAELEEYLEKQKKSFSFSYIFILLKTFRIAFWGFFKHEERIYRKCMKKLDNDLDVIKFLRKMQEIDKLKSILFDKNQRNVFDNIPDYEIQLGKKKSLNKTIFRSFSLKTLKKNKKKMTEELYQSYLKLKKDSNNVINSKLINFMDEKIVYYFEKRDQMTLLKEKFI